MTEREASLAEICRRFEVEILYAFGSRAQEIWEWTLEQRETLTSGPSDVDIGVKPVPGRRLSVRDKVQLAIALEDFFGVSRVDLVSIPEVDPFLAANIMRGERLYAADTYRADEYELYILRRAGDMAHLERERQALILGEAR